jgi:exosortase D (VPLPA-CTERM-specific)
LATFNPAARAGDDTGRLPLLPLTVFTLLIVVAGYFLFAESFVQLFQRYSRPEFSHGYLIPLISLWIVWQRRRLVWELRDEGAPIGWLAVAAGAGFALLTQAATISTGPYLGFIVTIFGLALVTLGWRSARLLAVPIAFLAFGFPIPEYFYVGISTSLQMISSQLGAGMLDLIGIPVYRDGNIIDLGTYQLQVAEACSGLRYLLPLLTFGVLCAYLYKAPAWAKLTVIAATVPITIVLNGARIALTGVFIEFGSERMAEGFMHLFEGWVIFLIALAILFGLMWVLTRLRGHSVGSFGMLDFDRMAGMPDGRRPAAPEAPAAAFPNVVPRRLPLSAAVLASAALVLIPLELRPQTVPERPGLLLYPMELGEWRGTTSGIDSRSAETLAADDYLLADYGRPTAAAPVNLWIAYYGSQLGDAGIHLPTTCLPAAGWEYVEFGTHRTAIRNLEGDRLAVNRGVIANGADKIVLYFWMEMRGRSLVGNHTVQFVNLWDSLVMGRSDGALIRVYTPLRSDEDAADADRRLERFLSAAYPHLRPHVGR